MSDAVLQSMSFFLLGAACCGLFLSIHGSLMKREGDKSRIVRSVIERLDIKPDDVVVFRVDFYLNELQVKTLREQFMRLFPDGVKVLFIQPGMEIATIISSSSGVLDKGNVDTEEGDQSRPDPFPFAEVKLHEDSSK